MLKLIALVSLMTVSSLPAFSQDETAAAPAPLFPATLCQSLPKLSADRAASLVSQFPDLKDADMRSVTASAAKSLLDNAVARNVSALELFTQDPARGDCLFYIPGDVIAKIDAAYDLSLLTPFSGKDTDGKPFSMTALALGKGLLLEFYDRDAIHYHDATTDNTVQLKSLIHETVPALGTLKLDGVTGPFGFPITQLKQLSATQVEVHAGPFTVTRPLINIKRKSQAASDSVAGDSAKALQYLQSLPSAEKIAAWMDSR